MSGGGKMEGLPPIVSPYSHGFMRLTVMGNNRPVYVHPRQVKAFGEWIEKGIAVGSWVDVGGMNVDGGELRVAEDLPTLCRRLSGDPT